MRNSTRIIVFIVVLLISFSSFANAQFIDSVYQFSEGDNDQNASFPVYTDMWHTFEKENFVFERHFSFSDIRIMMGVIGSNGPMDSLTMISSSNSKNLNPVIAYKNNTNNVFIIWEKFDPSIKITFKFLENGKWSDEILIDSNASSPKVVALNAATYLIVYQKNGDIIYRDINIQTKIISEPQNLTSDDTVSCKNPYISLLGESNPKPIVSYERHLTNQFVPIYYTVKDGNSWDKAIALTSTGKNKNSGFPASVHNDGIYCTFERNSFSNQTEIYLSFISTSTFHDSILVTNDEFHSYYSFAGGRPYIVRSGIFIPITGFIKDNSFDKRALFYQYNPDLFDPPDKEVQLTPEFGMDTLKVSLSASSGTEKVIPSGSCRVYWFLFNRSVNGQYQSRIHGIKFENCITNIHPISSEIPNSFALKQNYPNPFNPSTKIRIDIPHSKNVKLSVFNSLGQQVAVLVNEQLQPGIYEYDFNAENYSSGIYFYRLDAEGFSEAKRMVLIK